MGGTWQGVRFGDAFMSTLCVVSIIWLQFCGKVLGLGSPVDVPSAGNSTFAGSISGSYHIPDAQCAAVPVEFEAKFAHIIGRSHPIPAADYWLAFILAAVEMALTEPLRPILHHFFTHASPTLLEFHSGGPLPFQPTSIMRTLQTLAKQVRKYSLYYMAHFVVIEDNKMIGRGDIYTGGPWPWAAPDTPPITTDKSSGTRVANDDNHSSTATENLREIISSNLTSNSRSPSYTVEIGYLDRSGFKIEDYGFAMLHFMACFSQVPSDALLEHSHTWMDSDTAITLVVEPGNTPAPPFEGIIFAVQQIALFMHANKRHAPVRFRLRQWIGPVDIQIAEGELRRLGGAQ